MKTFKRFIFPIFLAVGLIMGQGGCTFDGHNQKVQTAELVKTKEDINGQAQIMVNTTVRALALETNNTPPIQLAKRASGEAQRLLGPPAFYQFDVEGWILSNKVARLEYEKQVNKDSELLKKQDVQVKELQIINNRLQELGKIKEAENNASTWWKFWTWSGLTLSVAGVVCFCIFTPFGPALLSGVLSIIWKIAPAVGSFFKVIGTKTLDNIVAGVETWKGKVVTAPVNLPVPNTTTDTKVYSSAEVQDMIKKDRIAVVNLHRSALSSSTDDTDKSIIDHRVDAIATPVDVPKA